MRISALFAFASLFLAYASPAFNAFKSIDPCRQLDTRTSGGSIQSGVPRNVTLIGAPCGIPATATAVSANVAVFNVVGAPAGNAVLTVYPTGNASATVALINWTSPSMQQIDNAAILVLGTGGAVTVQANQGGGSAGIVIDVNGYFEGPVVRSVSQGTGISVSTANEAATVGIAPGGVTSTELAPNAVTLGKIAPGAVDTSALADQSVTAAKISPSGSSAGQVLTSTGSAVVWGTPPDGFVRTVVVGPVGTDAQNGAALVAAINAITGASASNPYVVLIEAGRYDLGSTPLPVRDGVNLKGWGVDKSVIKSTTITGALVTFSYDARFSDLTLSCDICQETVLYSAHATLERVNVSNNNCNTDCYGIANGSGGSITLVDSWVSAHNNATSASTTAVQIGAAGSISRSSIEASTSGSGPTIGISKTDATSTSDIVATTVVATATYGIKGERVNVWKSDIAGTTNSIFKQELTPGTITTVADSILRGPTTGATVQCAAVLDGSYTFYAQTCP